MLIHFCGDHVLAHIFPQQNQALKYNFLVVLTQILVEKDTNTHVSYQHLTYYQHRIDV